MSGDLETAAAALDGLDTDGGADDADILLARGKYAFFTSDFDVAQAASEEAQRLVLAGERNWKVLDLVALQGLLAHRSGSWFDRMRARAAPHPGEPGDRQRHLRRLPLPGRVPAVRPDALRRGHRAWPATCRPPPGAAARCGPPPSPRR